VALAGFEGAGFPITVTGGSDREVPLADGDPPCPPPPALVSVLYLPKIVVTPSVVPPGGTVQLEVTRAKCRATVVLVLLPGEIPLVTVTVNYLGAATVSVTLPGDLEPGEYELGWDDSSPKGGAWPLNVVFTVTDDDDGGGGARVPKAVTDVPLEPTGWSWWALTAGLGGLLLIGVPRHRRTLHLARHV